MSMNKTGRGMGVLVLGGWLTLLPPATAADNHNAADQDNPLPPELEDAVQNHGPAGAHPGSVEGQLHHRGSHMTVDCDRAAPGVVQRAIDASDAGGTILVSGTCTENIVFPEGKDLLTLDGAGTATIVAASNDRDTIVVRGRGITVTGVTVRGGRDTITVSWGSNVLLDGNTVERAGRFGILVAQVGAAVIINCVVQENAQGGIVVAGDSFSFIGFTSSFDTVASPNTVKNNGGNGISLIRNSTARISGNVIRDNATNGVNVGRASIADLSDNTIDGNGTNGIQVLDGSGVNLGEDTGNTFQTRPNTTTIPNGQFGVRCAVGGVTDGRLGTLNGTRGAQSYSEGCINSLQ